MRPDNPPADLLVVRPFGLELCDLEVDFSRLQRPQLVTQILVCCGRDQVGNSVDCETLWELAVGQRVEALVRTAMGPERQALGFTLNCANPDCAQSMDLELALEELADLHRQAKVAGTPHVQVGETGVILRRPTGRDQLTWQQSGAAGQPLDLEGIVRSLVVEPEEIWVGESIPPDCLQAIEAALDAVDPLVNFIVQVACPHCNLAHDYPVNLQEIALRVLKQVQLQLLAEIHDLASHFHWTESEIMELPEWRRKKYLMIIDQERDGWHPV